MSPRKNAIPCHVEKLSVHRGINLLPELFDRDTNIVTETHDIGFAAGIVEPTISLHIVYRLVKYFGVAEEARHLQKMMMNTTCQLLTNRQ